MSSDAWLCLGGVEIVNQQRTTTYAQNGWRPPRFVVEDCGGCGPEIAYALGEPNGEYSNPGSDQAPWFSASEPESLDFGGLLALDITGLEPGQLTRSSTTRGSGVGSFLSRPQQEGATVTVTGVLLGRTCCSVWYGYRWLRNVLRGSCDSDCTGDDLTFLDCCPEWCEDGPEFTSYEACMAPYVRMLKGVSLSQSPSITGRYGEACGCGGAQAMTVTFQLSATEACVYREPVEVASGVTFDLDSPIDCPVWVPTPAGVVCVEEPGCVPAADCVVDPLCPVPAPPPTPPVAINPCVCEPLGKVQACITIEPDLIPEFAEAVPIIEVAAGSSELRQVNVRFTLNPLGLPPDQLDPCLACGEVTLSRVPPNAVFRMDGQNRTVTIECPGSAVTDAGPLLGSAGGRLPFTFPEIDCSSRYTMCVTADSDTTAADATVSLSLAVREC